jgi:uncharacterized membrane protein YhaH (DUF805 family)
MNDRVRGAVDGGRDPRRTFGGYLRGRSSRKEYWLLVGLLIALAFAVDSLPGAPSTSWGVGLLLFLQIRRLHDFGRTGWWAGLALLAPLGALPLLATMSEGGVLGIAGLITFAGILWIGVIRGDVDANRFGPPPPRGLKRMLLGQ